MSLNTGEIIDGKYRIVRLIGEGGMGSVYEGENTLIHRRVAIKVLHAGLAESGEAVMRFEREAQAAGRIGSEHIVEVLDLGLLPNKDRYMVMEFMDGDNLRDRIAARGRMSPTELYPVACQILEALAAAHGAGIIHRDLKPDNVFLLKSRGGRTDFIKLLDFGISKFSQLGGDSGMSMTRTGSVMGTPYYMAPEQAKGARDIDHRVDLYAVGVILYEALTGQVPFNADTFNELLFKIVLEQPPPIEQVVPDIDPNFANIVRTGMARDRAERYATAQQFREALDAWASGQPVTAPAGAVLTPAGGAQALTTPAGAMTAGAGRAPSPATIARNAASQGPQTPTPGAWSQTGAPGAEALPAPKKKTGAIVAVAALAGLLVVGGAAWAIKSSSDSANATAAAAEAERLAKVEADRKAKAEAERLERDRQAAEQARQEAEKAKNDTLKPGQSAQAQKSEKPSTDKKAPVEKAKPAEKTAVKEAPAHAEPPKTEPKPTKPAATATSPGQSVAGRKITTSL